MSKKTEIQLPKSVKKSDSEIQKKYTKAFEKSMEKHNDEERARKSAITKLQKKHEKIDHHWVSKDEAEKLKAEAKAEKKAEEKAKKSDIAPEGAKKPQDFKPKESKKDKKDAAKKSEKKSDKKAEKSSEKSQDKKKDKSEPKGKGKKDKSAKKQAESTLSQSDHELIDMLDDKDFDPNEMIELLEEREKQGENITLDEAAAAFDPIKYEILGDAADELTPEVTEVGASEGADPEETDDPVAAQEAYEDALAEPNLAEALEEEPAQEELAMPIQEDAAVPANAVIQEQAEQSFSTGRLLENVTRAQLYKEAQELKIPGRSNMNKEELFAAVEMARQS